MSAAGAPVVSVAAMAAAEQALFDEGISVEALMQRAGEGAGALIWRIGGPAPTLVVCGPGNNGGDGYVIAEYLRRHHVPVMVAAAMEPRTDAARAARSAYQGDIVPLAEAEPRAQFVDCLFGSGLTRAVSDDLWGPFQTLHAGAQRRFAIDLPSGVDADRAVPLNEPLCYEHGVALGAYKFAHVLEPAAQYLGSLSLIDIGARFDASFDRRLAAPRIAPPAPGAHKYSRGLVVVLAGTMPGAAVLAAIAAQGCGAGYVKIAGLSPAPANLPPDIVWHQAQSAQALGDWLDDPRIAALLVGPGLGRDEAGLALLDAALERGGPMVIDADALMLLAANPDRVGRLPEKCVLTPHQGEFSVLEQALGAAEEPVNKVARAKALSDRIGRALILKGRDSVLVPPGEGAVIADNGTSWLSVAGSGDVLAGALAARLAVTGSVPTAMREGQWLHGRAAVLAGPGFSAAMLARALPRALAQRL